jgi:hypothetical protein
MLGSAGGWFLELSYFCGSRYAEYYLYQIDGGETPLLHQGNSAHNPALSKGDLAEKMAGRLQALGPPPFNQWCLRAD